MTSAATQWMNYDPAAQVLEVEFASGAVYEYFDVPETVYQDFIAAPSHGKFFAYHFRDHFPYRKKPFPRR